MDGDISGLPHLRPERVEPTIPKRQHSKQQNRAFQDALREEDKDEDKSRDDRDVISPRPSSTPETDPPPGEDPDKATDLKETDQEHIDYQA